MAPASDGLWQIYTRITLLTVIFPHINLHGTSNLVYFMKFNELFKHWRWFESALI